MEKRINYIDIARAFAITFIVLGHTIVHSQHCNIVFKVLYSFHIALFFILSGYTFKIKQEESFPTFLKNKFSRIMIPYFIWALLFLIPYFVLGQNIGNSLGTASSFSLKEQLFNVLYGNGNNAALKQNSSLWFLPALFSMEIVYYFIINLINKREKIEIPILLFSIVVCYITYSLPIVLPWGLNTVLNFESCFLIGYLFKKHNVFSKKKLFKVYYIIPILVIGLLACFYNKEIVSCIDYEYGNIILALLSGISLSIFVIYISYIIDNNKILEYIGKNTMGILIFHKLIILVFQTKLGIISSMLKNSNIILEMFLALGVVALSIAFSLLITEIIKKIIPCLVGEKLNYKNSKVKI